MYSKKYFLIQLLTIYLENFEFFEYATKVLMKYRDKINKKFPKKLKMSKSIYVDLDKYGAPNILKYREIERQSYCPDFNLPPHSERQSYSGFQFTNIEIEW